MVGSYAFVGQMFIGQTVVCVAFIYRKVFLNPCFGGAGWAYEDLMYFNFE